MPILQAHPRHLGRPRSWLPILLACLAFLVLSTRARAQEEGPAKVTEPSLRVDDTIVAPPGASLTAASDPFDTHAVWRAEDQVKRARSGLIATAASFGVGWIFLGAASSQCDRIDDEVVCNNAGQTLGAVGIVTAGGGLIGMIVSGILLPVRQKRARDVRREIYRRQHTRLRWDAEARKVLF